MPSNPNSIFTYEDAEGVGPFDQSKDIVQSASKSERGRISSFIPSRYNSNQKLAAKNAREKKAQTNVKN